MRSLFAVCFQAERARFVDQVSCVRSLFAVCFQGSRSWFPVCFQEGKVTGAELLRLHEAVVYGVFSGTGSAAVRIMSASKSECVDGVHISALRAIAELLIDLEEADDEAAEKSKCESKPVRSAKRRSSAGSSVRRTVRRGS